MENAEISSEQMDELLQFLPAFENPDRAYVREWAGAEPTSDGTLTFPYPIYCEDVLQFYALAGQGCWSDFDYEPREAHEMLSDDTFIAMASIDQVRTMLTYCVRGERFGDGHWAHMLESGRIVAILRRLAALRAELT